MGYARHIGRIGALAVALGVGVAVATTTPAIANAAPSDSSTGTSSTGHARSTHASGSSGRAGKQSSAQPARSVRSGTQVSASAAAPVAAEQQVTKLTVARSAASQRVRTATNVAASLTPSPQAPVAPSSVLFAVLAQAVRRELEQNLGIKSAAVSPTPVSPIQSPNLLVNPGAEVGDPSLSGYASVTMPGWTVTGTPTVIEYGTLRRLPGLFGTKGPTLPGFLGFPSTGGAPPGSDNQFFGGGNVATSTLTQTVDLTGIAAGTTYNLSGYLGGYLFDPSRAKVTVNFLDANQGYLGSGQIGPVTALDRWLQTGLQKRETTGVIPTGTSSAQVVVTFTDLNPVLGNYNNAYADNLSLTVGANLAGPSGPVPQPDSNVGALDHVFMVYMENHGVGDIVGSPNAPYINSLINAYGYAANYYALTHPSGPNYYPILGGSDFGVNYNCAADCFNAPNLADEIISAGLNWAAYQDGGGGYSTPTDRTPFLGFHDIYTNENLVNSHIFDISQMATDLQDPGNVADFVWFAADDATNMEGPIGSVGGILQWAVSQLTTHQYNVKAGDEFLQSQMSVIFNSALWSSNEKTAVFLTFDEDYNNISWGIGNEGNHIVMVVIPNQAAITAGMRSGAFVANDYYNHYSLQRTIELSLGLQPLTNNDKYAQPMDEFWKKV